MVKIDINEDEAELLHHAISDRCVKLDKVGANLLKSKLDTSADLVMGKLKMLRELGERIRGAFNSSK